MGTTLPSVRRSGALAVLDLLTAACAYSSLSLGADSEIYAIRPDGSGGTNITRHGAFDAWPDWRPVR